MGWESWTLIILVVIGSTAGIHAYLDVRKLGKMVDANNELLAELVVMLGKAKVLSEDRMIELRSIAKATYQKYGLK